ncbi:MAG: exosortase [Syntrophotaleaceae bacterium]
MNPGLERAEHNRYLWVLSSLLGFAFLFAFLPTWRSLIYAWSSSDDYSHGFLIVPLSLYIVWKKRGELRTATNRPNWLIFPLVVFSLLIYLVAKYAEILTLAPLSMILFIGASLFFLFGGKLFRHLVFPWFLLVFMVPVPSQIYAALTIPLQLFVTEVTAFLASLFGIPILREGNVLYLPEHTLQVVQACSGLRSIMSLLTLGAVIGYFGLQKNFLRGVLFISAIPVAILVNIVRVLLMVFAFYYFSFDLAEGIVHTIFGAAIFGLAMVLFLLARKVLALCEE